MKRILLPLVLVLAASACGPTRAEMSAALRTLQEETDTRLLSVRKAVIVVGPVASGEPWHARLSADAAEGLAQKLRTEGLREAVDGSGAGRARPIEILRIVEPADRARAVEIARALGADSAIYVALARVDVESSPGGDEVLDFEGTCRIVPFENPDEHVEWSHTGTRSRTSTGTLAEPVTQPGDADEQAAALARRWGTELPGKLGFTLAFTRIFLSCAGG